MTHPCDDHIDELLPAWLNGTLALDERERIRTHLDQCATCRSELEEWRVIATAVQAFADTRLVREEQNPDSAWTPGEATGGTMNAIDRWIDLAGRSDETPPYQRSTLMNGTLPTSTTFPSPNGTPIPVRQGRRGPSGWMGRLAQGLTTVVMIALLIALAGGVYLIEVGLPVGTGGGDQIHAPGFAASPTARSHDEVACDSPGYRPVVEGEVDAKALAAIGLTETPLNIDGGLVHIPTSTGEIVTLESGWTPLGGPMWSNPSSGGTGGETTIRNIETGDEWTYPRTNLPTQASYFPPHLVVPANSNVTDFRVIDTESGDETLISELRGAAFTKPMHISQIGVDLDALTWPVAAPVVLLFGEDEFQTMVGVPDPSTDPGTNVLFLPADLDEASFARDRADATYFHETAYAPATNHLAYATEIDGERSIVVIEPGTDNRIVLRHPDVTAGALPLMFSTDGSLLVVSQPGALFTFDLEGDAPSDPIIHSPFEELVMPIAHNAASMNVVVRYPDDHMAITNARSGETEEHPGVIVPPPDYVPSSPDLRLSFETDVHELFDDATGTVRFVNLILGTVTPELPILNPEADSISTAFQPEFSYIVRYPHTTWTGGYAYLDDAATLQVVPTESDGESWSVPPPAGFEVGEDEVARLFANPDGTCLVLQVATGSDVAMDSTTRSEFVATWVMPLEPDAQWTKLDVQLSGWFPIFERPEPEVVPARDFAAPAATPASTALSAVVVPAAA